MSYLYVGVGGSGAKLMHALVHLTAAGLLPTGGRELMGLLVDSDQANGNVEACLQAARSYQRCKELHLGSTAPLFRNQVVVNGPWSPVEDPDSASLSTIFDHTQLQRMDADAAALMELLFSAEERALTIFEGFRGRPAIGSAIFGKTVSLESEMWKDLHSRARHAINQGDVSLLLAGSVFGGSGAAGVPTICRVLQQSLDKKINNLRLGLMLFLPYFTYDKVEDEAVQANPLEFATATAEALKYYDEGHFLDFCDSIYAVGDRHPAKMPIPAVGKKDQRNPAHFVELVAGLGAIHFMSGNTKKENVLLLAGREGENTVKWADLPTTSGQHPAQMALLQQFILFAVAYHYILHPEVTANLHRPHPLIDHLGEEKRDQAGLDLKAIDDYLESFLSWLLCVSTPDRVGVDAFVPGLVDVHVFAVQELVEQRVGDRVSKYKAWRLKSQSEFNEKHVVGLFSNLEEHRKPNLRAIFHAAAEPGSDPQARGAGKLVRAIYEACKLS